MRTILRTLAGSHLCGLNHEESDRDEMGICLETPQQMLGFNPFHQIVTTKPDVTVYGLRKFVSLALSGNPTIIQLLFVDDSSLVLERDHIGRELQNLYPEIVSKQAGKAFLGYLNAQKLRMLGLRGNGGHGAMREELTEKYGYDTKYAMHMLRLGMQGVELLKTGKLTLPMLQEDREYLLGVRHGLLTAPECIKRAEELENQIKELMAYSSIRRYPDEALLEQWLVDVYFRGWKEDATI